MAKDNKFTKDNLIIGEHYIVKSQVDVSKTFIMKLVEKPNLYKNYASGIIVDHYKPYQIGGEIDISLSRIVGVHDNIFNEV